MSLLPAPSRTRRSERTAAAAARLPARIMIAVAATLFLGACGGGSGGTGLASAPPPVASPTPTPTPTPTERPNLVTPVTFLRAPTTQEFPTFSTSGPAQVRYDAASGEYQVMLPGKTWDALVDDPQSDPGLLFFKSTPNINAGTVSQATRHDSTDPDARYSYASLARWQIGLESAPDYRAGWLVFAQATPQGGVPTTGTASYKGIIAGSADLPATSGWGDSPRAPIGGDVLLQFDFGRGQLEGQMRPVLACDCDDIPFPVLTIPSTVFPVGSTGFSSRFTSDLTGANSFSGLFAGPHAEELIGQWTFPFLNKGVEHSAVGVWIAKPGN